jgi:hypothetical protein
MCFVWIWEQTAIISLWSINWLDSITETGFVYCAVRTGSLNIEQNNDTIIRAWHCVSFSLLYPEDGGITPFRSIANYLLQTGRHIPENSDLRELCCECLRSLTDLSRMTLTADVLFACAGRAAVLFGRCILESSCEKLGPQRDSDVLAKGRSGVMRT